MLGAVLLVAVLGAFVDRDRERRRIGSLIERAEAVEDLLHRGDLDHAEPECRVLENDSLATPCRWSCSVLRAVQARIREDRSRIARARLVPERDGRPRE